VQVEQLPRDENGIVIGQWRLRHHVPDYSDDIGPAAFRDGVTIHPLEGRDLERIVAALGADLDAEPWEAMPEPEMAAIEPTAPAISIDAPEPVMAARAPAETPTNEDELLALDEEQLRDLAAQMGATDRRWKFQKLRRFIADELGIELGETV
jgi:hypothetical protein